MLTLSLSIKSFPLSDSAKFTEQIHLTEDSSDQHRPDGYNPPVQADLPFLTSPVKAPRVLQTSHSSQTDPEPTKPDSIAMAPAKWRELRETWIQMGVQMGFIRPGQLSDRSRPHLPPAGSAAASTRSATASAKSARKRARIESDPESDSEPWPAEPEVPSPADEEATPATSPRSIPVPSPYWRPSLVVAPDAHSCPQCLRKFGSKEKLEVHVAKHTGKTGHKCSSCGKCFSTGYALSQHVLTHKPAEEKVKCLGCNKVFSTDRNLMIHKRSCGKSTSATHQCPKGCPAVFTSLAAMAQHVKRCGKPKQKKHPCSHPGCSKAYIQHKDLLRHQRLAHGGV